ncbi:MAG TPA: hypothetical protein VJS64_06525 [Pyrinomonadaceae bacterium]|nr:hypothetical protein [Pyrinomonadaceae bacterium]
MGSRTDKLIPLVLAPFLVAWAALWLFLWALTLPFKYLYEWWLAFRFRQIHGRSGRFVLFIYSDSPNWKDYIETNLLPQLSPHVVTLNWSQRAQWRQTNPFEARVFRHWASEKEFNPMALIFSSPWTVIEVRLWRAFRDLKHGKDLSLRLAEDLLLSEVERIASKTA